MNTISIGFADPLIGRFCILESSIWQNKTLVKISNISTYIVIDYYIFLNHYIHQLFIYNLLNQMLPIDVIHTTCMLVVICFDICTDELHIDYYLYNKYISDSDITYHIPLLTTLSFFIKRQQSKSKASSILLNNDRETYLWRFI